MVEGFSPVGVAGCGRMGAPMLAALRSAGVAATGFDVRPPSEFGDLEPQMVADPLPFAAPLRTLITVVRDQDQTEALLFDDQGLVQKAPQLDTLIVSSTLSPRYFDSLHGRLPGRVTLLDAPMSGAEIAAQEARLTFMLGGEGRRIDAVMPLFFAMGESIHRMGPPGSGMRAKVLNNLLAAASMAMTRQVMDWARGAGLDGRRFLQLVNKSSGQNWITSGWDSIEFAQAGYEPGNSLGILLKDTDCAVDALPPGADIELIQAIQAVVAGLTPYRDDPEP